MMVVMFGVTVGVYAVVVNVGDVCSALVSWLMKTLCGVVMMLLVVVVAGGVGVA